MYGLFALLGLLSLSACQTTGSDAARTVILEDEDNSQASPYSELTRQEAEETIRRYHKIRSTMGKQRARHTGPIRHVWDRISAHRQIDFEDNLRIEEQATYLLRDKDYIYQLSRRTEPFIYFILEEIDKRGLPAELALLPVIESAYHPNAVSRSNAVGLWQFIRPTSRFLGMQKNTWYDARRDIIISTRKALDYLATLNEKFDGDWLLTLAAYNGGHGTISRAIARNQRNGLATDFWSLRLVDETRNYVPRFLAATLIYTQPEDYAVELYDVSNKPFFAAVDAGSQLDLKLAATMAGISHTMLKKLNAGYLRWSTPPNGPHRLLIPINKAKQFKRQLAKLPSSRRLQWGKHTVTHGETLTGIALRYGTTISHLKKVNRITGYLINIGTELRVPLIRKKSATTMRPRIKKGDPDYYVVQSGDTLWEIARQHGLTLHNLLALNHLEHGVVIKPGQQLRIRAKEKVVALRKAG